MRDWGGWGAEGGLKHPFGLKEHSCAFSMGVKMGHKLIQSTREAKTARSSLVPNAAQLKDNKTVPSWFNTAWVKGCL